ncbi:MAG: hypothetical protein ACRDL6_11450 [Solirubrobacterales bacterium]
MRKFVTIAVTCAVAISVGATGALAGPGKGQGKGNGNGQSGDKANARGLASQECAAEKKAMGVKAFKGLYGEKKAMRNCRAKQTGPARVTVNNAAQQCRAEQADPNFAASHGGMTFDQFYGTNVNDRNAFGKCVSGKAQAQQDANGQNVQNAARECKAERGDPNFAADHEGKSFEEFYGTNRNNRNAFGKCVSGKAKQQPTQPVTTPQS